MSMKRFKSIPIPHSTSETQAYILIYVHVYIGR